VQVVPVLQDGACSTQAAVHGARDARTERFHPTRESAIIIRLHQEVEMIGLDRVVDDSDVVPGRAQREE
jgi:hypothetical protein